MSYLNSADLTEFEDYPEFFDAEHPMVMVHSHSPGMTLTAMKVPKEGLKPFGKRIDISKLAANNSISKFTDWIHHPEYIEIPSTWIFKNESFCNRNNITIMTALYNGYGKMAPLRRNVQ